MKLSTQENNDLSAYLTGVNPQENTNWVKIETKTFNGTVPSGSFDISNCDKFKVECETTATSPSQLNICFGSDTTLANYRVQTVYGQNAAADSYASTGFRLSDIWTGSSLTVHKFSKNTKYGFFDASNTSSGGIHTINRGSTRYTGIDPMNSLNFIGSGTFTGTITVYKWQDVKVTNLATWDLVKEYNFTTATTLNDTITGVDWDSSPNIMILTNAVNTVAFASSIMLRLNGTTTPYNYGYIQQHGAASTSAFAATGTTDGLVVAVGGDINTTSNSKFEGYLKSGSYRTGVMTNVRTTSNKYTTDIYTGQWTNTTSPITSLTLVSNNPIIGNVKVFRLATKQLLKQNTQPVELVLNKTYIEQDITDTIDCSDCDIVEIEWSGITNNTNGVFVNFNNDTTTSNYLRLVTQSSTNSSAPVVSNSTARPIIGMHNGYVNSQGTLKINTKNKNAKNMFQFKSTSGTRYSQMEDYDYIVSEIKSLVFSGTGFTGQIKVYKKY